MSQNSADKAKRKLLMIMIFAPGIFFIIYWFAIQSDNNHDLPKNIKPPVEFQTIGQSVRSENIVYTAHKGSQLFTDRLDLKNNVAIAEPGAIFLGLGLDAASKVEKPDAILITQNGNVFRPLDVEDSIVAKNFDLDTKKNHVYMFKVNTGAGFYYFQVHNKPELTWRVKEGA